MKVLHSIDELSSLSGPVYLAVGVFDGVHLGHQAVIARARGDACAGRGTAVVVTFDPHPLRLLRPQQAPRLLTSTSHKMRLIRALGVEHLLIIPFDAEFAAMPPEDFIRRLASAAKPLREICVGHQWAFGKARAGNLEMLGELGRELSFAEVGLEAITTDGQIISSTWVRAAVRQGDFVTAARLLGREYAVLGTVVEGSRVGRTLGFPTANLSAHNEQFPPDGVYAVTARWKEMELKGVVNIGVRPTIANTDGERLLELHIFDFNEQIYGEDIEVSFRKYLRPEKKFQGLDQLRTQIALDVAAAKEALECFFAQRR